MLAPPGQRASGGTLPQRGHAACPTPALAQGLGTCISGAKVVKGPAGTWCEAGRCCPLGRTAPVCRDPRMHRQGPALGGFVPSWCQNRVCSAVLRRLSMSSSSSVTSGISTGSTVSFTWGAEAAAGGSCGQEGTRSALWDALLGSGWGSLATNTGLAGAGAWGQPPRHASAVLGFPDHPGLLGPISSDPPLL